MTTSLPTATLSTTEQQLASANNAFNAAYPGDRIDRQPVHTLYGGAHLFKAGVQAKLGSIALRNLAGYAPDFCTFARAIGLKGSETLPSDALQIAALTSAIEASDDGGASLNGPAHLAHTIYSRVCDKLKAEPIEDQRIDFEDGYGNRTDEEEDGHAIQAAGQLAEAMAQGSLGPFIGIRIKPFSEESRRRSVRTLDMFITHLAKTTGGKVPNGFVITLPKITIPAQVTALADLLDALEAANGIEAGAIGIDLMIEVTQAIFDKDGNNAVPLIVQAGRGRVVSCAFGTYDYTATCNITAAFQTHTHPACDFARHVMQVSLAGTGVTLSDGATTVMPIGPHRAPKGQSLSPQQLAENREVVHSGWKLHFDNIFHSLGHGYYQGWDLNPGQLPIRYAAVYAFFLDGLADASLRLNKFLGQAAQATLVGNTFDDAATGQGLLNFFLRGLACGALTEDEVLATGITLAELRSRSFVQIVAGRAG
ncbi:MAG: phosphoenolpyruvate kinase [Myxococcales bacterium]|nr:phosphoenolpyruvate kinase [Myxococcales bacterium]